METHSARGGAGVNAMNLTVQVQPGYMGDTLVRAHG
jgi:hypothetical protein